MKRLAGLFGAALVAAFCVSTLEAQILAPGRRIEATDSGYAQLDSMAKRTLKLRVEQAMCLTGYALDDSILVVVRLKPAKNVVHADSVSMGFSGPQGEPWQPCVHSHLPLGWPSEFPSPVDSHSAVMRGVFGLLMVVKPDSTWTLKPYP